MSRLLSIGQLRKLHTAFRSHQHESWEIVLYTEGSGTATIGEEQFAFQTGTIICMPPRINHSELAPRGYRNIYMHTDEWRNAGSPVPVFQDTSERHFYRLASVLFEEFHHQRPGWEESVQDLFQVLLKRLERIQNQKKRGGIVRPEVEQLKDLLVLGKNDPSFTVGDAYAEIPLSEDHLRRLFVLAKGKSPGEYLTTLRIEEAKRLLRLGGFSVKETAFRSGFADQYYFSRLFKKITGVSPGNYRN